MHFAQILYPMGSLQFPSQLIYPTSLNSNPTCILGNSPVCSKENVTFPNICVLLLTGQEKKSDGWCQTQQNIQLNEITYKIPNNGFLNANEMADPHSPCACNSAYNPVCGNNGVTYASRCRLDCSNVALSHNGPCNYTNWKESPHFNCPCNYEFSPVCGKDGSTYENECAISCGFQAVSYEGACRNPCNCTNVYKPVCSKKKENFTNVCKMKCANQELWKAGKCPDSKPDHCSHCDGLKSPVCGSNGVTYDNNCYLGCAGVIKYNDGICPDDNSYQSSQNSIPSCFDCKNVYLPVCGTGNVTYDNACKARCKGVSILYKGKCLKNSIYNNSNCSEGSTPVCGTDGRTYQNKCEANLKKIKILYNKPCPMRNPIQCQHLCGNSLNHPVCGKDGRTYANECVAKCSRVPVKSYEKCKELNSTNYPSTFDYPEKK